MSETTGKKLPTSVSIRAIKFAHEFERQYVKQIRQEESGHSSSKSTTEKDIHPVYSLW